MGAASLSQMRMKWARRCFGASVLLGLVASVGLSGCSHAAVPGLPRVSRGLVPGRNGPRRLHHVTWPAQRHRRRPGAHRRGTTALPRPRIRLGVSRYATRIAHIRPDDRARRETISVGSHRRLPSCFGDLARVRHQEEQAATEVFPSGTAKPPYPTTSTVVYYRSHWTVQRVNTDVTRTCSGG